MKWLRIRRLLCFLPNEIVIMRTDFRKHSHDESLTLRHVPCQN